MHRSLRTWLQLLRAPNLFTVAGDPMAGFFLANFGIPTLDLLLAIGASLCFYAAGLLDNDFADLAEDRRERPERPLPSGAAQPAMVLAAALALVAVGLGLCAALNLRCLQVGASLVLCVALYNHWLKRLPFLGAAAMGLCRALSLLLGAAAAPAGVFSQECISAALIVGLWIAAVTNLARFETQPTVAAWARWLPAKAMALSLLITYPWTAMGTGMWLPTSAIALRALLIASVILSIRTAARIQNPTPLPPSIGEFIRLLLPLQAAFCAITGLFGLIAAGVLLTLWPLSKAASRRFYAS